MKPSNLDTVSFKVSTLKIAAGFGVSFAAVIAAGVFAVLQIKNVESNDHHIVTNNLPGVEAAGQIRSLLNHIRRLEARHLMAKDDSSKDAQEADMAGVSRKLAELEVASVVLFESEFEAKAWGDYKRHQAEWRAGWANLRTLSRQSVESQAAEDLAHKVFTTDSYDKFRRTLDDTQVLIDYNKTEATRFWETSKRSNQYAQVSLVCGLIAATLLFAALVFIVIAQFMILASSHPEAAPQI